MNKRLFPEPLMPFSSSKKKKRRKNTKFDSYQIIQHKGRVATTVGKHGGVHAMSDEFGPNRGIVWAKHRIKELEKLEKLAREFVDIDLKWRGLAEPNDLLILQAKFRKLLEEE